MIVPQVKVIVETAANQRVSATRLFCTRVRFRTRPGAAAVRIGVPTRSFNPDTLTAPATLDDTNSVKLEATATQAADTGELFELSAGEIERGQYYDLKEFYYNGTGAGTKIEVIFTPVGQMDK